MTNKTNLLRCIGFTVLFIIASLISFSQTTFKVTGKVSDPSGKPLEGATVQVKGTTTVNCYKIGRSV